MITLDSNDNDQVKIGGTNLSVSLGDPSQTLLILSGTAIPGWMINDDDHDYFQSVVVNLRTKVLAIEQATVSVGLASIGNDDTEFLFATQEASLDVDQTSQELLLKVDLALRGESTGLYRFGYQVVALVTTQETGISGTIRWDKSLFDATGLGLGQVAQMFNISANKVETIHPPNGFAYFQYTPLAFGVPTGVSAVHGRFEVPYEIPGAPYNQPLVVLVTVGPGFKAHVATTVDQSAGPNPVTLTTVQPGVAGVDFDIQGIVLK